MERYLRVLEEARFARPPWGVFSSGAGNEMYAPATHLAFNTPAYLFAGMLIRRGDPPGRHLDLGCGSGYDIAYLKEHFSPAAFVSGIDRSPAQLRYALKHYSRSGLVFTTADNRCLPFKNESFDTVTGILSIVHNMTQPVARVCLVEISRILKPNGILIFSTPNRELFQDLYHDNPDDDPRLRFISRFLHEYTREGLSSFLGSLTGGEEKPFESYTITGLANTAFRQAWEETVSSMRKARFRSPGEVTVLSTLARRFLPTGFGAWYFYRVLARALRRSGVSLTDIARNARVNPESKGITADQFMAVAQKRGGA